MTDTLPADYRSKIAEHLPKVRATLEPASAEAFAVAMDGFVGWIEAFGVIPLPPADSPERLARIGLIAARYREHLADLPADLVELAFKRVMAAATFSKLPLPGEVRKAVAAELAERKVALHRLEAAHRFGRFAPQPVPPEERVRPEQVAALHREIAAMAAARAMPDADTEEAEDAPAMSRKASLARAAEQAEAAA